MRTCCLSQGTPANALRWLLNGKEIQKGGDICVCITDLFCCPLETLHCKAAVLQQKFILEKAVVPHQKKKQKPKTKKKKKKKTQSKKLTYHRNVPGLSLPFLISSTCQSIADTSSFLWFTGGCLKDTEDILFCFLKSFVASSPYSNCPFW